MQEENINALYQIIIDNSWNDTIDDYLEFISIEGSKLSKDDEELNHIFDEVLKKILYNLKNNVNIDTYDNMIINLGIDSNQDGYDFAIGLIKSFYRDEFIINNKEYTPMTILLNIIEQYKTEDTPDMPKIMHYTLKSLFRIHYALYVKKHK